METSISSRESILEEEVTCLRKTLEEERLKHDAELIILKQELIELRRKLTSDELVAATYGPQGGVDGGGRSPELG